jgi:hypothetical protein
MTVDPATGDEEVLDLGRPGGRRRGLLGAGAVLAAAGLIAGLLATHRHGRTSPAAPLPTTAPAHSPAPALPALAPVAADTIGDTVYLVEGGSLATVDVTTGRNHIWHRLGPADGTTDYRVVADGAHHQVFVLSSGGGSTTVDWFDSGTLVQPGRSTVPGRLADAALLDGRLYVSTASSVVAVGGPSPVTPRRLAALRGGQTLAADPSRHRLLIVHLDAPHARIEAQRPDRGTVDADTEPPYVKGDVVVIDGRIWAAGFGEIHAVLTRLDPGTLRPVQVSPLESRLGPGAVVVAATGHRFLVRDGGGGPGLWCLDATGAIRRFWPAVTGTPVFSSSGIYVLAAGQPLQRLNSSGCPS